jgi:hypothetical protein
MWLHKDLVSWYPNKIDHHDITEILLKVALNIITLTPDLIVENGSLCVKQQSFSQNVEAIVRW